MQPGLLDDGRFIFRFPQGSWKTLPSGSVTGDNWAVANVRVTSEFSSVLNPDSIENCHLADIYAIWHRFCLLGLIVSGCIFIYLLFFSAQKKTTQDLESCHSKMVKPLTTESVDLTATCARESFFSRILKLTSHLLLYAADIFLGLVGIALLLALASNFILTPFLVFPP